MKVRYTDNNNLVPDIIGTQCVNTIKLKDVEFPVRCGKCLPCLKSRRNEWSLRLEHEYLHSDSAFFITLTYDDNHLPYSYSKWKYKYKIDPITKKKKVIKRWKVKVNTTKPTLRQEDLTKYIKRIRNEQQKYYKDKNIISRKVRYYAVGEYGTKTKRPHYHLLVFNYDIDNIAPLQNKWKLGFTQIAEVNGARINYTAKYMFKPFNIKDTRKKPFSTMSKKPIIGQDYLNNYGTWHIKNEIIETADQNGVTRRLPKPYLRRLFTNKEDRIQLSLKSIEKYKNEKEQKYLKKLEKHFNGSTTDYINSIKQDLQRRLNTINNSETL